MFLIFIPYTVNKGVEPKGFSRDGDLSISPFKLFLFNFQQIKLFFNISSITGLQYSLNLLKSTLTQTWEDEFGFRGGGGKSVPIHFIPK